MTIVNILRPVLTALPRGQSLPDEAWVARHRWMQRVLWAHVAVLFCWSLISGDSLLQALLGTGVIAACGIVTGQHRLGRRARAAAICIGLLTASAVVVHLMHGAIEGHFHFFVMVTLLALYQAWFPYLLAFAYVLVHHGIFGALVPETVFNHHSALHSPW